MGPQSIYFVLDTNCMISRPSCELSEIRHCPVNNHHPTCTHRIAFSGQPLGPDGRRSDRELWPRAGQPGNTRTAETAELQWGKGFFSPAGDCSWGSPKTTGPPGAGIRICWAAKSAFRALPGRVADWPAASLPLPELLLKLAAEELLFSCKFGTHVKFMGW